MATLLLATVLAGALLDGVGRDDELVPAP